MVAALGILRRRAWARRLALPVLAIVAPFWVWVCTWTTAHGGDGSWTSWLMALLGVAMGNGALFYLIYRKSSADALQTDDCEGPAADRAGPRC